MNAHPAISRFLADSLRMDEDATGKGTVARAVAEAMRREGISDPQAYEKLFVSSPEVRQRLINTVVVGETWFFRDRGPFTCLARYAREFQNFHPGDVLRILSAPCSTGEEPYSIVMTLLAAGMQPATFSVDGVDVSTLALEKARRACYGSGSFRGTIGEDVAGFIHLTTSGRQVNEEVVRQVTFYHENLVLPGSLAGYGPYSVIFCRNLLIYLTMEARRQIFERLDSLLLPGGIIFAGHAETIFWHQKGYLPVRGDRTFALTKPVSQTVSSPMRKPLKTKTTRTAPPLLSSPRRETHATAKKLATAPAVPHGKIPPSPPAGEKQQPVLQGLAPSDSEKPLNDETLQKARRLADRGDMEGALSLCREYDRTVGPAAETYCLMGIIHEAGQDLSSAEECFLKALYLDPGHYESLVHASLICRQKGDKRKADLYRERAERKAGMKEKTDKKKALHKSPVPATGK